MLKKILKITGITLLILLLVLIAAPFLFKDKIKAYVVETINNNVDAVVAFEDVDLSLLRNFPKASVKLHELSIINKAPFEGDTLVYAKEISLSMSVKELFKSSDESMEIKSFGIKNSLINVIFNEEGIGNFDIAIKDEDEKDDTESEPFSLKVSQYSLEGLEIRYTDLGSKTKMKISELNHYGSGDFGSTQLDLDTKTTALLSLDMDKTNYLKNMPLKLDAILGIDLENSTYTFKQNEALINQLPLKFDGYVQMLDAGQQMDITFETPTSAFTNFLGLIPSAYSGSLDNIKTTGDFSVKGMIKGLYSENTIPTFDIAMASNNASFKYPDLPKSVENIVIDVNIKNQTGLMKDIFLDLNKLSFRIDQDVFDAKAKVLNLTENALVDAQLKGTINLGNLSKAYPIQLEKPLNGILKADIATKFDMQSIEKEQYQNIQNTGSASLTGFTYVDENGKGMDIKEAVVLFNPQRLQLQNFEAKTGKSDMKITGALDNFYGYLFKDQTLKGNFNLTSNQIDVADFMTTEEVPQTNQASPASTEAMKIPAFLDCSLTAKATTVLYDNLTLKDVAGTLMIKDEAITLENVRTNIFGGQIAINGAVSTKETVPTFDMNLGLNNVDIAQTFTQLDMLKSIAPIANVVAGRLNSTIKVGGNLDAVALTPDLKSIRGDLMGQLLESSLKPENSKLLSALDSNMNFVNFDKININNLKAALTFDNGKVNITPFEIKHQDISMRIGGTHGFDQSMNYDIKFDVPAKYLGKEVNNLIAKLTPAEAKKIETIPVSALLSGNFSAPKVSTDLKQATTNLANQLVQQQKQALMNQGTAALSNLVNPKGDSTKTPIPTTKEEIKEEVKEKVEEAAKDKIKQGLNSLIKKKDN